MINSDEGLLRAILDDPDHDALRLVYADWLEEHGARERAEFIRVQIQLTSVGVDDPRYPELRRREAALCADHQAAWLSAELPPGMGVEDSWDNPATAGFHRGFPARIVTDLAAFLAGSEALARIPAERVHLPRLDRAEGAAGAFERLAACPALAHFPRLDLKFTRLGVAGLAVLLSSPHLPLLRELCLGPDDLGTEGGRLLAGCARLGRLTRLDVGSCRLGTPGVGAVLHSPRLPLLEDVRLGGNDLDDEGARLLASLRPPRPWRALDVSYNELTLRGVRALLRGPSLRGLEVLDLASLMPARRTWLGDDLAEELLREGLPEGLRRLDLHSSEFTHRAAALLAGEERLRGLGELNLALNHLGEEGARALARSPHLAALERLELYYAELDDAAAAELAASPYLRPHAVSLCGNVIGPAGVRALAGSPLMARVVSLDLHENPLRSEGLAALTGAAWLGRVHRLGLARARVGPQGVRALAGSPALAGVVRLDLRGNGVEDEGARALADSPYATGLRGLDLADARIGDEGAQALARSPHLGRLRAIDLSLNPLGPGALKALRERFGDGLVFRRPGS